MLNYFSDLRGHILSNVENKENLELIFTLDDGSQYKLYHNYRCCEDVFIEDVNGDLQDLIGTPVLVAEEAESSENPDGVTMEHQDSFTWTFYKLATTKGYVTIRWYGKSNGCYSESVDWERVE